MMIAFGKNPTHSGDLEHFSILYPPPELLKPYIHADLRSQYFSEMSQEELLDILGLLVFLFFTRNKY